MAAKDGDYLSIRVEVQGLDEAGAKVDAFAAKGDASLKKMGDSGAAATDKLSASLTRWTYALDPAARAQASLAKGTDLLNQSLAAGLLNADRHNQLLQLLTQRYGQAAAGANVSAVASTRLMREARAAFSEFSSGNVGRGMTTLGMMATHIGGLSLATVGFTAAIAGIPIAMAVAAAQSEAALQHIQDVLRSTGAMAGVTSGQILEGGDRLAAGGTMSLAEARASLTTLAASGHISGDMLEPAAALTPYLARATGGSQEEATKLLAQILADPAKGAEEAATRFNALDAATLRVVERLTASGQSTEAQRLVIEALTARLAALGPAQETFWSSLGSGISNAWNRMGAALRGPQTTEERIAALQELQGGPGLGTAAGEAGINVPSYRDAISALQDQQTSERQAALDAAHQAQQTALIRQAESIAGGFDSADARTQKLTDQASLLAKGLAAAQEEYDKLNASIAAGTEESPDATQKLAALKAILDELTKSSQGAAVAAEHQLDPAALALKRLQEQGALLAASPRNREQMRQRQEIDNRYAEELANPSLAATAGQRRDQAYANLHTGAGAKDRDAIDKLREEAAAQTAIAQATEISAAAAVKQKAIEEAHAAFLSGAITDEKAYAAALLARAAAQGRTEGATALANAEFANAASVRMLQASAKGPAAEQDAARLNQAISATRGEFASAQTPEDTRAAQQHLDQLKQELDVTAQINQERRSNDEVRQLQQALEERRLELGLWGQNLELADREIADLRLKNQLIAEGLSGAALDTEYAKRKQLTDQIATANAQLKEQADFQRVNQQTAQGFTGILTHGLDDAVVKGENFHKVMQGLRQDLSAMALRMTVEAPFQNMLSALLGGRPGPNPLDALMGGGSPIGGGGGGGPGGIGGVFGAGLGSIGNLGSKALDWMFGSGTSSLGVAANTDIGSMTAAMAANPSTSAAEFDTGGVPGYAEGGDFYSNEPMIVGEEGPELLTPSMSGSITPNNELGGMTLNHTQHNTFNFNGGSDFSSMKPYFETAMKETHDQAVQTVFKAMKSGGRAAMISGAR